MMGWRLSKNLLFSLTLSYSIFIILRAPKLDLKIADEHKKKSLNECSFIEIVNNQPRLKLISAGHNFNLQIFYSTKKLPKKKLECLEKKVSHNTLFL